MTDRHRSKHGGVDIIGDTGACEIIALEAYIRKHELPIRSRHKEMFADSSGHN